MKNIGELAKAFRTDAARGWNTAQMAAEVTKRQPPGKPPVLRQHIEQLEAAGDRIPRYIVALAKVMGTTTDALFLGETSTDSVDIDQPDSSDPAEVMRIAVNVLATCLHGMDAGARTEAGYLLQKMAETPDGRWAGRLADLIEKETQSVTWSAIGNSVRAGKYSLRFQNPTPTMAVKRGGAHNDAVNASALPTGTDNDSGSDRDKNQGRSGGSPTGTR